MRFADWFSTLLPEDMRSEKSALVKWARCYDDLIRLDKRTREKRNLLTSLKLRKHNGDGASHFDVFETAMKAPKSAAEAKARAVTQSVDYRQHI